MKAVKLSIQPIVILLISASTAISQPRIKVVSGQISLSDLTPAEIKYKPVSDSLDRKLKLNPNDTTALFYRAVLYLSFNSIMAKPDLTNDEPAIKLLIAKTMSDRADSLAMKNFNLKILQAQISKQLTFRYGPADSWRFNAAQLAGRKKKYQFYKDLANRQYDELAALDPRNASDYQRLKIK